jgi:GntR family transcriptional regulator / MocR family aminotransferase
MISGRFEAGTRLPASRALATSLGVSRITVTECYDRLISEGYLETRRSSGTFVSTRLPEQDLYASGATIDHHTQGQPELPMRLSRYGASINAPLLPPVSPEIIRLDRPGPDVRAFPKKLWTHLWARRMQEECPDLLQYTQEFGGNTELRVAVAQYLQKSRAVVCDPSQIIIVNGSQQAIYLAARVLLVNPISSRLRVLAIAMPVGSLLHRAQACCLSRSIGTGCKLRNSKSIAVNLRSSSI